MICVVCGNKENNTGFIMKEMMFGYRDEFQYFECFKCGCLQIEKIPENIENYYPREYYSFTHIRHNNLILRFLRKKRDKYALEKRGILGKLISIKFPNKFLECVAPTGLNNKANLLEVGCGAGNFLYSLKDSGFENLTGIDPYIGKEIHDDNLTILKKTIFELDEDVKYDFILFNGSFEHLTDQSQVLLKVQKILVDEGICVIQMPVKTQEIWKKYSNNWVQIDCPRHFVIHTLNSFNLLIKNTNLFLDSIIFNSNAFQFWGSELYIRDIPLIMKDIYISSPKTRIFSKTEICEFENKAKILNKKNEGDHAIFILTYKRR